MICPVCHFENREGAAFCGNCKHPLETATPPYDSQPRLPADGKTAVGKNQFVATLIAFFLPSFGQLYNGDIKKWLVIFVALLICVIGFGTGIFPLIGLGIYIWSIVDAYQIASGGKAMW